MQGLCCIKRLTDENNEANMITTSDFQAMQARLAANKKLTVIGMPVEDESELHAQILAECKRRLWPVIHSRMDARSTTSKGTPDMAIFADKGRTFLIECKTRKGKLTPEQIGWQMLLERNSHSYHVVRSFEEFLAVIGG